MSNKTVIQALSILEDTFLHLMPMRFIKAFALQSKSTFYGGLYGQKTSLGEGETWLCLIHL